MSSWCNLSTHRNISINQQCVSDESVRSVSAFWYVSITDSRRARSLLLSSNSERLCSQPKSATGRLVSKWVCVYAPQIGNILPNQSSVRILFYCVELWWHSISDVLKSNVISIYSFLLMHMIVGDPMKSSAVSTIWQSLYNCFTISFASDAFSGSTLIVLRRISSISISNFISQWLLLEW